MRKVAIYIIAFATVFSILLPKQADAFADLGSVPWAEEEINYLYEEGIINGYNEHEFAPANFITRAEVTQIIVSSVYPDETSSGVNDFSDVSSNYFYSDVISIAADKGLISGYLDETFRPNEKITRAEAAVIIDRTYDVIRGEETVAFPDMDDAHWALGPVLDLASQGIMSGYPDGTVKPEYNITRAEFAVMTAAAMNPEIAEQPVDEYEVSELEQKVVDLTNEIRTEYGLTALKVDPDLSEVARLKSQDMRDRDYFEHTSPHYGTPFSMMQQFGITYESAAENIAAGQVTAAEVVNSWMNSEGHRENILQPGLTHIGVGHVEGGSYGTYWTQMFIKK